MCSYWLKMIGTAETPCPDPYENEHVDFTRNPASVRPGDGVVLYAVGGQRCVFAVGTVKSKPKPSGVKRWRFRVEVAYEVNRSPSLGVPVEAVGLEHLLPAIRFGSSYLRLTEKEFAKAKMKLRDKASKKSASR